MELFIEKELLPDGQNKVLLYAKEHNTSMLIETNTYTSDELPEFESTLEKFNERPWFYHQLYSQISKIFYEKYRKQEQQRRIDLLKNTTKRKVTVEQQEAINAKIKATKLKNKANELAMIEQLKNRKKEILDSFNEDNTPYYSSGLNGFHCLTIYVEPSISDDCYGFGDIKVQQTIDEDIESLYAYYEDYIF